MSFCKHVAVGHNYDVVYQINNKFTIQVRIWQKDDKSVEIKSIVPKAFEYTGIVHKTTGDTTHSGTHGSTTDEKTTGGSTTGGSTSSSGTGSSTDKKDPSTSTGGSSSTDKKDPSTNPATPAT